MKNLALFVINLFAASVLFAQPTPDTLWTRTFGGSGNDRANSIQQTADGGYVVAGYTNSYGAGDYDYYVVKTNSQGNTVWTHTYGGLGNEGANFSANSIRQTTDGGYVVVGYTNSFGAGGYDFFVVKTNFQGDTLWTRTYGGNGTEGGFSDGASASVQQTTDSGYVIAGNTISFGAGNNDYYVVKTNGQGDTLWTHTYGGGGDEWCNCIQQTTDGGYIVAGISNSFGRQEDFYVVKTNSQGDTLWTRTYGGNNVDQPWSLQQTSEGGFVIAGVTNSFGAGNYDYYVVKTNALGDTLWTRTYGGIGWDDAKAIQQSTDGGYVIAGNSWSWGAGNADVYVVKTNGQGNMLWTRTYGGSAADFAYSIRQTTDNGYVVAGGTSSFGAGGSDFYVVKTGTDSLCVTPATPQVVITTVGEDTHLNWLPVTQSVGGCPITVSRYLVFYSPTSEEPYYYHGYTAETSYVHWGVISYAPGMFYNVIATTIPQSLLETLPPNGADSPLTEEQVLNILRQHSTEYERVGQ